MPKPRKKIAVGRRDGRTDKALVGRLIDAVLAGNTYENAAQLCGITSRTFYRWMAEGRTATNPKSYQYQFFQGIQKAEASAIHRNVIVIQQAARNTWQAAAWYLERRRPAVWGRFYRGDGLPLAKGDPSEVAGKIDVRKLTPEQRDQLKALLTAARVPETSKPEDQT